MDTMRNDRSSDHDHLGRGWAFPVRWWNGDAPSDAHSQPPYARMVEGVEDIYESIRLILETSIGERVMNPDFGSDVYSYVFATIDPQSIAGLAEAVRGALLLWERRIREVEVVVAEQANRGIVDVQIEFLVDTHRMRHSLVFPFYVDQPEGV